MHMEYASNAWAEIVAQAAVSPLGISALVILVVGFVILALVRPGDSVFMRLTSIVLLLIFCGALTIVAFYHVQPTTAPPEHAQSGAQSPASVPITSAKVDCGIVWSGWINVGGAVGNPCPSECFRGDELGQSYRIVGFPPRPQVQHKFQCWRN